ncbi:MAG: hydrolase [Acidimicrobiales bacterium]|nr:hydrolase [Acidimicrobiales bacterium]
MEIDAALFDFGGVLVHEGSVNDFARLAPHADPAEVLRHAIGPYHEDHDHPWHRVERGELDMAEWYTLTVTALAEAGIDVVIPTSGSVLFTPNEPVVEAVREVRAAGGRTAVVTNNVRELSHTWRPVLPLDELFDTIVDSCEVGLRKPNPAIYLLAVERLGVAPERAVLLDDIESNLRGAEAAGLRAIHVEPDPTAAVEALRALL